MGLYNLFSCNVEIQYKSYFLSKAMLFTTVTTFLTIILPFILAYRSRGFWLKSHEYFEQPTVHFTYEYLLVAETEDLSQPIMCGEAALVGDLNHSGEEFCAELQVQEKDYNTDNINDILQLKFLLNIPKERTVASITLILALDFQLKNVCPYHMQSLAVINRNFAVPPSGLKYYGDIQFHQVVHLPCLRHHIDNKYNTSVFEYANDNYNENVVDFILENYFSRQVITETKTLFARSQNGHTGTMTLDIHLRIPEVQIKYTPSLLQELKWAWPQYLSIVIIFYWIFYNIKRFVFKNRLIMAWEVVPWKKN
ncbi:hypothetical protein O0L34_g1368 [Tuta absoluta]|nr:hypothetical protein O0L34_g1368 [Tuta absoluta]